MGMFDSIRGKCPNCNKNVEIQTKLGECLLREYNLDKLPVDIATAIAWKKNYIETCEHCNSKFMLQLDIPAVISGKLVVVTDEVLDEIKKREYEVLRINVSPISEDDFEV